MDLHWFVMSIVIHCLTCCSILCLMQSDVNSVCFADEASHLIYSGSDDNLCKVNPKMLVGFSTSDRYIQQFQHLEIPFPSNWMEILILRSFQVWDRRCFRSKGKPAGILMGHLEGITFLDSRNDGRYFISNGKDQTIKLWDIRKMSSNAKTPYVDILLFVDQIHANINHCD